MITLLGYPSVKKKKGRDIQGEKKMKIRKKLKLTVSHLLDHFARIP